MCADFRSLNPISLVYEHDNELIINQNTFATQQGLTLNLVNAFSGCKDETILNYSNIFLTKSLPVNDVISLPPKQNVNLVFPTFIALSALTGTNINTLYLQLSSNPSLSAGATFSKSLSDSAASYFAFTDLNGIKCRISQIDYNYTKNLTVDLYALSCYFSVQTPTITANNADVFEYSLDNAGGLKLFFRQPSKFYIVKEVGNTLSAVDVTLTVPTTADIFLTNYKSWKDVNFKNDFVYYDKSHLKDFSIDNERTIENISQNNVLFYNYQSNVNFISGAVANIDFYNTKNILSDNFYVNDKLPFSDRNVTQREYTTILSKQNSETYNGNFQLNFNYYTKEYSLIPDITTRFTLPETIYPYSVINVSNSDLVNAGSYGGLSPVYSDKLIKKLNPNTNTVKYNEANGIYLYTWLFTNTNQLTSYWLDRYYFPHKTTLNNAYSGLNNQIFNYQSSLSAYLQTNYPADDYMYYDIRSSLTLEPSASYLYSRIGNKYINKVVDTYAVAVSTIPVFNSDNSVSNETNDIVMDGDKYGAFKLNSDLYNSFTISFDLNAKNINDINSNLIVGNNFDEGISIYKGGLKNIFTPGYMINSLTGVDFFDIQNNNTFSLNVSSYVGVAVTVLDIINTGFDHLVKIFYIRNDNNIPGFLDFSILNKVFNKYEFNTLVGAFRKNDNIILFGKAYQDNSQIVYITKPTNPATGVQAYTFDYLNNAFIPPVGGYPAANKNYINNIVSYGDTLANVTSLSGFGGGLLDGYIGVSKAYNTVYFRNLSGTGGPTALGNQYPVLSTLNGGIFDVEVLGDRFYVQTNGYIESYDQYKRSYTTYELSSNAFSGIKIDFINDNYQTKLLSYAADNTGHIIVDRFDLQTGNLENTFNTGIQVDPIFFKEFNSLKKAEYDVLYGIGIVNSYYVSGGQENSYTWSNPLIVDGYGLTAFPVNAVLGGVSQNCNSTSSLSGTVSLYGSPIPTDLWLVLYEGSTAVLSVSGDGKSQSIDVIYKDLKPNVSYSLECIRELADTVIVNMGLQMVNGSFYNGSFRNVVVAPEYVYPGSDGFANTFSAFTTNSLTDQYGFVQTADSTELNSQYTIVGYSAFYNLNGNISSNPYTNFYHYKTNPHLVLVANPETGKFKPNLLQFTANASPAGTVFDFISGAPFQVPTNFATINKVNKFSEGNMVARLDLYAGSDVNNKQTEIIPFNVENNSQVVLSFDVNEGFIRIYNNAELLRNVSLSSNTFYTSYFLNNNFGVGMPFINNRAASTIGQSYNDYASNYTLSNFTVYDRPLNVDEVKFNFLKDKKIDPINFDITSGTRNDTDTATSFNKLIIPGRKNNDVVIYIKNAFLDEAGKAKLSAQLLGKVKNIIPLNSNNVEFRYIDYESN